ncbi:GNAT family N-acetyltransferase [Ectobacillus polymachus]|uniref:GNAT family N-acetyltransferase n=1 Tax=Ectobacillus polymachus TaxID=1508806 RepID=UPI003A8B4D63
MNPLLLDFPTMFQTKRLQLRKPFPGDGSELYEVYQRSASDLNSWLSYGAAIQSEDQAEADVREAHAKFLMREQLRFHLYVKEDNTFIGSITLQPVDWDIRNFEVSCWLASDARHKGYMTEALTGSIKFAFEKLQCNRLEIRCDSRNEDARQLAERTGFILEGTLHKNCKALNSDDLCDTCIYAKIKE